MWLGSRRRHITPAAGERKHKGRYRHADGGENRCDGNALLTKQGANALSQCGVFMEEPPELNVSRILLVWDRRVTLFVERASSLACLSISMSESTLSSFLIRSRISFCILVSTVSVSFRCSRARCLSTSDFRSSILVSFARLFVNSSLTPVIDFLNPAASLLAWVTQTVSIGRSPIVVSTCSAL